MHCQHLAGRLHEHVEGWVAIPGDVLNTGAEPVRVLHADHVAVVAHAEQYLAAYGIG